MLEPSAGSAVRTLIFSALILALLCAAVYSYVSLSNASAWLRHMDEVRVRIALVRGTLLDAETGLRKSNGSADHWLRTFGDLV